MKYLLDTNACVRYINARAPRLVQKLRTIARSDMMVSAVTKAELFYGSAKSQTPQLSRQKQDIFLRQFKSLPFDDVTADYYGMIRAMLERRGTPISHPDLQIAAIALVHDLILVTHNTKEFSRVDGLRLEDWEA
ncbi:MAG: type II toxin-antitoxin system VapC family toxin [Armatimonadetes bacterium]|nr:type II toxin-antitoxin system VapC family toxin [Anaerolineae bacterium]